MRMDQCRKQGIWMGKWSACLAMAAEQSPLRTGRSRSTSLTAAASSSSQTATSSAHSPTVSALQIADSTELESIDTHLILEKDYERLGI